MRNLLLGHTLAPRPSEPMAKLIGCGYRQVAFPCIASVDLAQNARTFSLLGMAELLAYFPTAATSLDATIVAVYLLGSLSLGVLTSAWVRRRRQAARDAPPADHEEDYYLAGRRVPGWVNGISYAVTAINADVAPHYFGFAVVVGLPISFYYLPRFAFAWMIAATLFAVRWRQLGVRTGPEFYALRFDPRYSRFVRVYSALFAVGVNMIPWIGRGNARRP